jgi:hypothetical protein
MVKINIHLWIPKRHLRTFKNNQGFCIKKLNMDNQITTVNILIIIIMTMTPMTLAMIRYSKL